jgi:hypothetical protein
MRGLRRVRRFRYAVAMLKRPFSMILGFVTRILPTRKCQKRENRILVWAKESAYTPSVRHTIVQLGTHAQSLPLPEVRCRQA